MNEERQAHLAWHETLELHELVAMNTTALMKLKLFCPEIQDSMLQQLYQQAIGDHENQLTELVRFYPKAPRHENKAMSPRVDDSFYAAELLNCAKTSIKSYAIAVTEAATPSLKSTFVKHLNKAIECHTKVFNYMQQKGDYPAYDLNKLLEGDLKRAKMALDMEG
ncbi:spore coat protein F [Pullulanibacillus pueri]|uniref:Spore coat protein F n=1 Tax=Pullulanibacillus pueri TaxID=1437324 RepID=A0A8J2ZZN8_9BACL|nr:spore coat protein [Pullulanibacillus pueri]MBM7683417.1 spore coat protein F [Pullulanibacillus pueri]GGH88066.1 spore coat protein F [Pullulanibacillus pueri]